jgi:hypothetical protein
MKTGLVGSVTSNMKTLAVRSMEMNAQVPP